MQPDTVQKAGRLQKERSDDAMPPTFAVGVGHSRSPSQNENGCGSRGVVPHWPDAWGKPQQQQQANAEERTRLAIARQSHQSRGVALGRRSHGLGAVMDRRTFGGESHFQKKRNRRSLRVFFSLRNVTRWRKFGVSVTSEPLAKSLRSKPHTWCSHHALPRHLRIGVWWPHILSLSALAILLLFSSKDNSMATGTVVEAHHHRRAARSHESGACSSQGDSRNLHLFPHPALSSHRCSGRMNHTAWLCPSVLFDEPTPVRYHVHSSVLLHPSSFTTNHIDPQRTLVAR